MLRRLSRLLIALLCTALLVTLTSPAADARRKNKKGMRVAGITRVGQDWYNSRLKVGWRAVPGSSYQMRWSYHPSKLSYSKVIGSGTSGGTYSGALHRGKTWYFQVRAIRSGRVGPWSPARGLNFINYWPKAPTLSRVSQPGAVQFKWAYTPYSSRYRVRWSAAWYGQWPGSASYISRTPGGWLGQTARQSTYTVPSKPSQGDNFLAVGYANPVFGQVEANNGYRAGASQLSKWVAAFPTPAAPRPGDPVRMGTYNVQLYPTGARAASIARNISSHGVTVAALQESNTASASAIRAALGSAWSLAASGSGTGQQIVYRKDKFRALSSGRFNVPNPKSPSSPLATPWVRLAPVKPGSGKSQNFYVVSVHFSEDARKSRVYQNRDSGLAAKAAMTAINGFSHRTEPVIVAGDIRYGREPYGDPAGYTPAQPTFVRGGYYDAMAALTKVNTGYSVVNAGARQTPHPSGLGPRSDHILTKGIRGSRAYVNVVNWSSGGSIPSDHNLVYADLLIPYL